MKRDDIKQMDKFNKRLAKEFEIEYLSKLKYFLEIEVTHSRNDIFISQQQYFFDLLKEIRMLGCKNVDISIE